MTINYNYSSNNYNINNLSHATRNQHKCLSNIYFSKITETYEKITYFTISEIYFQITEISFSAYFQAIQVNIICVFIQLKNFIFRFVSIILPHIYLSISHKNVSNSRIIIVILSYCLQNHLFFLYQLIRPLVLESCEATSSFC